MVWPVLEIVGLFVAILFLLYYYSTLALDFWRKRGVKGPKPIPFLGNFKDVFCGRMSINDCVMNAYFDYKDETMVGLFNGLTPILVLRDLDLMKDVLIKDFSNFTDRFLVPMRKVEPLSEHLFRLEGERWKPLRIKLSPVFTSGKLKGMFHLLLECANHFEKHLDEMVAKDEPIECYEVFTKYTTDVIGSCAFGIEMNALAVENNEFCKMGKRVFQTSWKSFLRDKLRQYPLLFDIFGRFFVDYELVDFFVRITRETIDYRIQHNVHRRDFIDTLVELKQNPEGVGLEELDDVYIAAQSFLFFIGGYETSSRAMTNALYELALNPSIQEKLRAEIKDVLQRTNGEITYDCIKEMKYLHACLQETLRKYPSVMWLSRKSRSNYTFSGTKLTIPSGQQIILPVYAIQHDPDIYSEPDVFDPNRFMDENFKGKHSMVFLAFGAGPRNCIGERFAKNQSKVGLIKILSKFKVDVCEKTCKTYEIDKKPLFLLQPTHGIYLKMTKLEV